MYTQLELDDDEYRRVAKSAKLGFISDFMRLRKLELAYQKQQ